MRGIKTIGYCSSWECDHSRLSIDDQKSMIYDYADRNHLIVQDFIIDGHPTSARSFDGFDYIESMIASQQVDNIIITGPDRICSSASQVFDLLGRFVDTRTVLHITSWNTKSVDPQYKFLIRSLSDIRSIDIGVAELDTDRLRSLDLWHSIHDMVTSEVYAGFLIESLFRIGKVKFMNKAEINAVYSGYDHLQLFSALGFRIKGEATNNTWLVVDVITRNWDKIRGVMNRRMTV